MAADPSQIRQIVLNIVTNASEALGGREGRIGVSARLVAAQAVGNAVDRGNGVERPHVELCVSDSGCGVSVEHHAKIFNPFFTTKGPGRGLGLAVVQGIVRTLNGSIRVESVAGTGTTVRVALPCAPAPVPAGASAAIRPPPEQGTRFRPGGRR